MTTAHRPTFDPAQGREAQRGPAYHQRLLPAHTHLKHRKAGQGGIGGLGSAQTPSAGIEPVHRDLRAELLEAEASGRASKDTEGNGSGSKRKIMGGGQDDAESAEDLEAKRRRLILEEARDVDADSDRSQGSADAGASSSEEEEEDDTDEDEDEDDDEDEEAELMRELAKIKAERAAAKAKEEEEKAKQEQSQREFDMARGNPLLNRQDFGVKRRWDDDVVFRNQARGTEDKSKKKEFVNDLLRSDFHKKFMSRYIR